MCYSTGLFFGFLLSRGMCWSWFHYCWAIILGLAVNGISSVAGNQPQIVLYQFLNATNGSCFHVAVVEVSLFLYPPAVTSRSLLTRNSTGIVAARNTNFCGFWYGHDTRLSRLNGIALHSTVIMQGAYPTGGILCVFALKTAQHQLICCSSISPCLSEFRASCSGISRNWVITMKNDRMTLLVGPVYFRQEITRYHLQLGVLVCL